MDESGSDVRESPGGHPRAKLVLRVVSGIVPLALALWCLSHLEHGSATEKVAAAVLAACYLFAFRTVYKSTRGATVPTEPVLVAMLLVLPATWVFPLVLLAATLGSIGDDSLEGLAWWQTGLTVARQAWVAVAPVALLIALGESSPGARSLSLVAAVIAVQLAADGVLVLLEELLSRALSEVVRPLAWTMAIDAMLAVVGYSIVEATSGHLPGLLLIVTPIVLMRLLSYDRETYFSEAQDLKSAYSEVTQEARRDPMTGLLNRRGWEETLEDTMAGLRQATEPTTTTILAADLDRLKFTNDTYGHLAGDSLICGFADILSECLPSHASIARLGGDEFAVIVTGPTSAGAPDLIATVRAAVTAAPAIGAVRVSASLGQATYPPAANLDAAVNAADHAARVDKEMRRMTREDTPPATSAAS